MRILWIEHNLRLISLGKQFCVTVASCVNIHKNVVNLLEYWSVAGPSAVCSKCSNSNLHITNGTPSYGRPHPELPKAIHMFNTWCQSSNDPRDNLWSYQDITNLEQPITQDEILCWNKWRSHLLVSPFVAEAATLVNVSQGQQKVSMPVST